MHQTSGRWQLGLLLTLITAFCWGLLPIALKGLLSEMDAVTVTWYRFASAAVLIALYLLWKRRVPTLRKLRGLTLLLMVIAILGLCGNYVSYLLGLDHITPSSAQVIIQLAPMFMLLGGLVFFREQFTGRQWLGFASFVTGLVLFFNQRFGEILGGLGNYSIGLLWMLVAAVIWAAYALAQKQLLKDYASDQIMLMIYMVCVPILLPWSAPGDVTGLSALGWGLLAFSCLNTLVAYSCFAEALAHWEASRVSAVLAITPLLTIAFMFITNSLFPGYSPLEPMNALSILGATMVVVGSIMTALPRRRPIARDTAGPAIANVEK